VLRGVLVPVRDGCGACVRVRARMMCALQVAGPELQPDQRVVPVVGVGSVVAGVSGCVLVDGHMVLAALLDDCVCSMFVEARASLG
jgi:hypothetical protein